jgi:hypothetical protein
MLLNSTDHGVRRGHTAAMGPHTPQQSTQQSTNIICDGSTSLKLEKKVFITSNMAINTRRIDDNDLAATRRDDGHRAARWKISPILLARYRSQ